MVTSVIRPAAEQRLAVAASQIRRGSAGTAVFLAEPVMPRGSGGSEALGRRPQLCRRGSGRSRGAFAIAQSDREFRRSASRRTGVTVARPPPGAREAADARIHSHTTGGETVGDQRSPHFDIPGTPHRRAKCRYRAGPAGHWVPRPRHRTCGQSRSASRRSRRGVGRAARRPVVSGSPARPRTTWTSSVDERQRTLFCAAVSARRRGGCLSGTAA